MNTLSEQSAVLPSESLPEIPFGFCHCGCGKRTRIAINSNSSCGWKKGVPKKFIHGHNPLRQRQPSREIFIDGIRCLTIPLTQGKEAVVDVAEFARLSCLLWFAMRKRQAWYAATRIDGRLRYMHQVILHIDDGRLPDHRNTNGLDNRRCNLREANTEQNGQNRNRQRNNTSKYFREFANCNFRNV